MTKLTLAKDDRFPDLVIDLDEGDEMFAGDGAHYLSVGQSALQQIERALADRDQPPRRILDLPCGHGRVTRFLRARYPQAQITVCDLNRAAVDFAARTFAADGVYSQDDLTSLDLGEAFDLIWVGSLITHFSEQQTRQVFDLAVRHLGPDGSLVISSHGAFVATRMLHWHYGLTEAAARGLLADTHLNGYGFRAYPGGVSYGISLVSQAWYRRLFARGPLELIDYIERGWDNHQDVLVLRRRAPPAKPASFAGQIAQLFAQPKPARGEGLYAADAHHPPDPRTQEEQDAVSVAGFDEDFYRRLYPDVAQAIADGALSSGLEHYLTWGWKEGRAICDPALAYDQRPSI